MIIGVGHGKLAGPAEDHRLVGNWIVDRSMTGPIRTWVGRNQLCPRRISADPIRVAQNPRIVPGTPTYSAMDHHLIVGSVVERNVTAARGRGGTAGELLRPGGNAGGSGSVGESPHVVGFGRAPAPKDCHDVIDGIVDCGALGTGARRSAKRLGLIPGGSSGGTISVAENPEIVVVIARAIRAAENHHRICAGVIDGCVALSDWRKRAGWGEQRPCGCAANRIRIRESPEFVD